MALATQADVAAKLGRALTASEALTVDADLEDASDLVIGYCRQDFESIYTATIEADDNIVTEVDGTTAGPEDRVRFVALTGGAPLAVGVTYFVATVVSESTFTVSAAIGGAAVDITADASAASFVRYPANVVRVVAGMVARLYKQNEAGSVAGVEQVTTGPFATRFTAAVSSGDVWLSAADKIKLRPCRRGGGLSSVQLVGERYNITP